MRTVSCFLKSTKQSVASETETKDLMGDSFKSRFVEGCVTLLQLASSSAAEDTLKAPDSEDLVFISASVTERQSYSAGCNAVITSPLITLVLPVFYVLPFINLLP